MRPVKSRQVIVVITMMLTNVRKRMRRAQKSTEASLSSGLRLRWTGNFIVVTVVLCGKEVGDCLVVKGKVEDLREVAVFKEGKLVLL